MHYRVNNALCRRHFVCVDACVCVCGGGGGGGGGGRHALSTTTLVMPSLLSANSSLIPSCSALDSTFVHKSMGRVEG